MPELGETFMRAAEMRRLELSESAYRHEVQSAWKELSCSVEEREYFEREFTAHGFQSPLQMAINHLRARTTVAAKFSTDTL